MDAPDPLLTAAQSAFQSLLTTAEEVNAAARLAFQASLKRQSELQEQVFKRLEQSFTGGGG